MVHHADRSLDGYSTRVRDGVIHVDELRLKDTEVDDVARLHGIELGEVRRGILVELTLDDTERETCAEDGRVYLLENVGHSTDMVLVSVCDEYAAYLVRVVYQVGYIRYDEVYTGHIIVGESHATVDDDYVVTVLEHGHILTYLLQTAETHDPELCSVTLSFSLFIHLYSSRKISH